MNPIQQSNLGEVAKIAVRIEASVGLPARMLIAQWAVESQWGTKPVGHANYFGIKRAARHKRFYNAATKEFVNGCPVGVTCEFADYDDLESSAADYAWLITHGDPYAKAWHAYMVDHDLTRLIQGVAKRYATSPSYASLVTQIAVQSNVREAVERASAMRDPD